VSTVIYQKQTVQATHLAVTTKPPTGQSAACSRLWAFIPAKRVNIGTVCEQRELTSQSLTGAPAVRGLATPSFQQPLRVTTHFSKFVPVGEIRVVPGLTLCVPPTFRAYSLAHLFTSAIPRFPPRFPLLIQRLIWVI